MEEPAWSWDVTDIMTEEALQGFPSPWSSSKPVPLDIAGCHVPSRIRGHAWDGRQPLNGLKTRPSTARWSNMHALMCGRGSGQAWVGGAGKHGTLYSLLRDGLQSLHRAIISLPWTPAQTALHLQVG